MNRIALLFLCLSLGFPVYSCKMTAPVKEPSVAGSFYPADPDILRNSVDALLANAVTRKDEGGSDERLLAMIAPHAALPYSGWVAAYGYKQLKDLQNIDTVIIIGPAHRYSFTGASVYVEGKFKTPLGEIPIDEELALSLLNPDANVVFLPEAYVGEHALEIQLPFLQRVLKNEFRIVPILINNPTREMIQHLVNRLSQVLAENGNALIVASTDMSHYYNYDIAMRMDGKMIEALERISIIEIESLIRTKEGELCGAYPVIVSLEAAKRLGANDARLFKYGNSGDILKVRDSVVGYSTLGFYQGGLTGEDKKELLALAREAIVERVKEGRIPVFETDNPRLRADGAAFVTIDRGGQLRGCIGHIRAFMPLYKSVITNAMNASSNDRRFKPMTAEELDDIDIEISVLSPLVPFKHLDEIELGKHGVYMVVEQSSAIFLPSVPVEFKWDKEELMRQLSLKAGLAPTAWKTGELYRFEATVIKESDFPAGELKKVGLKLR